MAGQIDEKTASCPECGAPQADGLTCRQRLCEILAWEWRDPELQAEHFLTVACYNLQHPAQFTAEALAGLRASFLAYMDEGMPAAEIRRRTAAVYDGAKRVLRREDGRRPVLRRWRMTVADAHLGGEPKGASARVRGWAAAVRKEL